MIHNALALHESFILYSPARQELRKHTTIPETSLSKHVHASMEKLLEAVFYAVHATHLQNRVFCATVNLDRCTPVRELRMAFKIPYVHGYITKLCRKQD
jgi:hypothetical protein